MATLEARLAAAHACSDGQALSRLYREAADSVAPQAPDASAFFLTHAWIWALETGAPDAPALAARLKAMGRL